MTDRYEAVVREALANVCLYPPADLSLTEDIEIKSREEALALAESYFQEFVQRCFADTLKKMADAGLVAIEKEDDT